MTADLPSTGNPTSQPDAAGFARGRRLCFQGFDFGAGLAASACSINRAPSIMCTIE
jgi:hypothetical protein